MGNALLSWFLVVGAVLGLMRVPDAHPCEELMQAHPSVAQSALGRDDARCCRVEGGVLCDANPVLPPCPGGYPWPCRCQDGVQGRTCEVMHDPPKKHDICEIVPDDPVPPPTCSTVATYCYTVKVGTCDHDGGPWSWGGFCWTCGCKVPEEATPQTRGSRNVCTAGSASCH